MPGAAWHQLEHFGTNSWETPFAHLEGDAKSSVLSRIHSYGDMPPWGEGPASDLIYEEEGYQYLKDEFPELDYIDRCYIVREVETGAIADEL